TLPVLRMPGLVPGANTPSLTVRVFALLIVPVPPSAAPLFTVVLLSTEPSIFSRPELTAVAPVYVLAPERSSAPAPSFVNPPVPAITPLKVLLDPVLLIVKPPPVLTLPAPITFAAFKLIVPVPLVVSAFDPFERLIVPEALVARLLFAASVIASLKVTVLNSLPAEPIVRFAVKSGSALTARVSAGSPRLIVSDPVGLAKS